MRCEKLRHHLLFLFEKNLHAAYWAREAPRLRQGLDEVVEAMPEHSGPATVTTAEATTGGFHHGERSLAPHSLEPLCGPRLTGK